ncbi:hypothetical protein vseg_009918 [Gypsophila vaccaria]
MFDGMPDHFYHFLAATSTAPPPPPPPQQQQPHFDASYLLHCHHHHQQQPPNGLPETMSPWSNEEVLALLKIRSTLDCNPWFPSEFSWQIVSRKLEEIGFKRSAENCKQKFEEQTRSFNNSSNNNDNDDNNIVINNKSNNNIISQNYRLFGELEELYNCNDDHEDNTTNDAEIDDHNKEEWPPNQLDYQPDHDSRSMSFCAKNDLSQSQDVSEDDNEGEGQDDLVEYEMGRLEKEKKYYPGNDETGERGRDRDEHIVDEIEVFEESRRKLGRKRRRQKKFEMFRGFCEKIVNKMMEQQEEFHCKIIQDMVKRDEEKFAREEAWKKQEIDMITKELEVRANEHAIVGDRQAKILSFLSKFTSSSSSSTKFVDDSMTNNKVQNNTSSSLLSTSSSSLMSHNCVSASQLTSSCATTTTTTTTKPFEKPNHPITNSSQDGCPRPTSISATRKRYASDLDHTSIDAPGQVGHTGATTIIESVKDDIGRRWPRDEVLALINIRSSLFNNNNGGDYHYDNKESSSKGPLWERVSQKMLELGYRRSSKRCKEKWENINKYFRKTKDLNKKRSTDSRTCPYFHQLSHLYNNQGPPHDQSNRHESLVGSPPENQSRALSGGQGGGSSTSNDAATTSTTNVHGNEGSVVQMSAEFGFEF